MTKGYVDQISATHEAILADYLDAYPADHKDVGRDLTRLRSCVKTRGLPFVMVDLPSLGKALDKSLSESRLTIEPMPGSRRKSNSDARPRLFWAMYRRVFDASGLMRSDADTRAIFFLRQLYNCFKKFKEDAPREKVFETIADFFSIESKLPRPTQRWDEDECDFEKDVSLWDYSYLGRSGELRYDEDRREVLIEDSTVRSIQQVADRVSSAIGVVNTVDLRPRHGPGAVSEPVHNGNKYLFPYWPRKLDQTFPLADFAFANHAQWARWVEDGSHGFVNHEPPSRLIAVPKTLKAPRLIAKEPIAHQWMQQAVRRWLEQSVQRTVLAKCISFKDQSVSGRLALSSSLSGTHATIDLSSASDRLTARLVERIFRRNVSLLKALHACRTRWLVNDIDKKQPRAIALRKFSPQGSSCTFPVQSIVFSIMAIGCVLSARNQKVTDAAIRSAAQEVQVFGDDIIIPADAGTMLVGALTHFDLKVNTSKSFLTGRFREACGVDAYAGVDVTPTYVRGYPQRSKPESIVSSLETCKNLARRGLLRTSELVRELTSRQVHHLPEVPLLSEFPGYPSFSPENGHLKSRYNRSLCEREYWVTSIVVRQEKAQIPGENALLQYFTEDPEPTSMWTHGIPKRPTFRLGGRWVREASFG